ncbi:MAG: ArsA family ATPase [Microthrixaceae bacterium]|nr:ArsA family ATPase [Microthrixaceae bacterium]
MTPRTLSEVVDRASVVVCCGSGGVGKTTTAALIAMHAAQQGRRSVVVTIDPARRLADALGLQGLTNDPSPITGPWNEPGGAGGSMSALMLDTKGTFDGLVKRYSADRGQAERILANAFYRNISGALSGTQEYMASEKLYELAVEGDFDLVVVDTPPTRNALDFLDAPQRLAHFLDHRLYKVLLSPSKGIGRAVNVATQAVMRQIAKVVGAEVISDALAFFKAFEGMEQGFKERAREVDRLLKRPSTAFVLVASPRSDTVTEAGFFADELARKEIAVQGLIVNRTQPSFGVALGDGAGEGTDGPVRVALSGSAVRARAETLAGTALGDHYRCLADSLHLAAGEAEHLAGLAERVTPAPVVKVPVQPFEVSDLESLRTLAAVVFADTSDGYGAGDSDAQQAHD